MGRVGRTKSDKEPIPVNIRVQMHRKRKEIKRERVLSFNTQSEEQRDQIETNENDSPTLRNKLQNWANSFRISKRAVDSLLCTLNSSGITSLPKNHRTLLKTPINIEINEVAGGQFWYHGLLKNLKIIFSSLDHDIAISMNFNIDGLPLYNSSKICFWPILASIHGE